MVKNYIDGSLILIFPRIALHTSFQFKTYPNQTINLAFEIEELIVLLFDAYSTFDVKAE